MGREQILEIVVIFAYVFVENCIVEKFYISFSLCKFIEKS